MSAPKSFSVDFAQPSVRPLRDPSYLVLSRHRSPSIRFKEHRFDSVQHDTQDWRAGRIQSLHDLLDVSLTKPPSLNDEDDGINLRGEYLRVGRVRGRRPIDEDDIVLFHHILHQLGHPSRTQQLGNNRETRTRYCVDSKFRRWPDRFAQSRASAGVSRSKSGAARLGGTVRAASHGIALQRVPSPARQANDSCPRCDRGRGLG
jgi:hypothetical protein